jgi:hypothetical protein
VFGRQRVAETVRIRKLLLNDPMNAVTRLAWTDFELSFISTRSMRDVRECVESFANPYCWRVGVCRFLTMRRVDIVESELQVEK